MAYVLSLSPNSPLTIPFGGEPPTRSSCSAASIRSRDTVHHRRLRSISTSSLSSVGSYVLPSFRQHGIEESSGTPPRSSLANLTFNKIRTPCEQKGTSTTNSRRTSLASSAFSGRYRPSSRAEQEPQGLRPVQTVPIEPESSPARFISARHNPTPLPGLEPDSEDEFIEDSTLQDAAETPPIDEFSLSSSERHQNKQVFRRWISKLRRRRHPPPPCLSPRRERWTLDDFDVQPASAGKQPRSSAHRKSDSQNSSIRFITSIRSATATIASASVATMARPASKWRRGQQRSSLLSGSETRPSIDSTRSIMDEAARQRSRKRREKLEELIRTEECYVADVKALSDAYFTILGHQPTPTSFARPAAQKVVADILHLHDDILGQLHRVVPFAEYDQSTAIATKTATAARTHNRWHSIDTVPTRATPPRGVLATIRQGRRSLNLSRSTEEEQVVLRCRPQVVKAVAQVFAKHIGRFAAYEEYGANYDLVQHDIEETTRTIASWPDYDKAIEALSAHVNPVRSREANRKRAMTVKDLLIKPIQRIPRYELLFNDLSKLTPVCDDPDSHTAISQLSEQLNGICRRTNAAKDSPHRGRALETTWLIGDRLSFSGQVPKSVFLQLLGQVSLCGCLHIAYRSKDRIQGCYVICVLFESTLLLASGDDDHPTYSTIAGIALANATVQEADNLRGLQCYTAPHSWKVVFEQCAQMYELIFTACSAVEADAWRSHISAGIEIQSQAVANGKANVFELHSPLTAEMKSVGKAFGKPGSFVRRMSVHRTATVGPAADVNQVIIKNTQAVKEVQENSSQTSLQIPRSQSLATPSHVQTLAPRRAERHRLEALLSDVWSRDVLPYPGMIRRSDPIRASANHVIRKFSMASITSNFSSSKRAPSYGSIALSRKEDLAPSSKTTKSSRNDSLTTSSSRHTRPAPVSFHTAPDAFLPTDFELQNAIKPRKKSTLRTFTLTMERPFSPLLANETNRHPTVRRAQSVRDVADDYTPPAPSPIPPPLRNVVRKADLSPCRAVEDRTKALARSQPSPNAAPKVLPSKAPRKSKSKSRLLRLFQ